MVIEWLVFQVASEAREKFIEKDREIWSSLLAKYPGFLAKEIWLDPQRSDRLIIVIRWQTRQQWKAVPIDILEATEQKFSQAMGEDTYEMIEVSEYQVRKFP
ncbi:MAG: TIGR03792 family protein [Xenococcaceae cyanobacterium MO_207.B15]|nr:TIGR03792 family protein [Xenococcaceae cyanobacterium MO_207.B15]MDJ0746607.1 TIGR03792 family protein [Xenococcaceae cyanobacterium MO_167.B27]